MKEFTYKDVKELSMNVESNFSELIKALIYFDLKDETNLAWNIVDNIEECLPYQKTIELLIEDFPNSDKSNSSIYKGLWYGLINLEGSRPSLVENIKESDDVEKILEYLQSLDEGGGSDTEVNIQMLIDTVLFEIRIVELLKDIENNFSTLINAIVHLDSEDQDYLAWDIIHEIEGLPVAKEIELLINDLIKRNYEVSTNLLYNSLWYALANVNENREILIELISKDKEASEIINYLSTLNEGSGLDGERNIQSVVDAVKLKI